MVQDQEVEGAMAVEGVGMEEEDTDLLIVGIDRMLT